MGEKIAGVTDEAVESETGRDWAAWLARLDELGAADLAHAEIVGLVADEGVENPWWHQKVAVGYERERGMREAGETADAGFQIGVQRTLGVDAERLWSFLVGSDGRERWLGETPELAFEPGDRYEVADGTTGEIRTVSWGERLRLTWQPPDWERPSTLQLTLEPRTDSKTTLRVHHERLADGDVREAMRSHWRSVLDEIQAAVDTDGE